MLVLTLASMAHAADVQAHVGVSFGALFLPGVDGAEPDAPARFEVGAGSGRFQGYFMGQFTLVNARPWYESGAYGLPTPFMGDILLSQLGGGVRFPLFTGGFRLVPHGELGLALMDSPLSKETAAEIRDYEGDIFTAAPHAAGPFLQVGVDAGWMVVPDAVLLSIGPELGYIVAQGVGVTAGVRVAASAQF